MSRLISHRLLEREISSYAKHHVFNPVKERIEEVSWDGVSRVATAFHTYLGAYKDDDEYIRFVSRFFFMSLIARCYDPGCNVYFVLTLEGKSGAGKSTFVNMIGKEYMTDNYWNLHKKNYRDMMQHNWLIEIPNIYYPEDISKSYQPALLKSREDVYRPSYKKEAKEFKRKCVFVVTTDYGTYNTKISTHLLPIRMEGLDSEALKADLPQLLAESLVRYKNGENWANPDSAMCEKITAALSARHAGGKYQVMR